MDSAPSEPAIGQSIDERKGMSKSDNLDELAVVGPTPQKVLTAEVFAQAFELLGSLAGGTAGRESDHSDAARKPFCSAVHRATCSCGQELTGSEPSRRRSRKAVT